MKRVFKWIAGLLFLLIATPVIAVLGIWAAYYNVVRHTPGALATSESPGPIGAQVDPFIGTGGWPWMCGQDTPAATTPFGMVRLGPDTASLLINEEVFNRSGYFYGDNKILGFSHTRLVGADSKEGGTFRILPTVAERAESLHTPDRAVRFSHKEERAFPGYYAVRLPQDDVLVELTATTRVGLHRYTFAAGDTPHLLLDVTSALGKSRVKNAVVNILPQAQEVEGSMRLFGSFSGRYDGLDVYFVARFDQPFAKHGVWADDLFVPGSDTGRGEELGVDLGFAPSDANVVEVRLALSYVSVANARKNLEAEAAGMSFAQVAAFARAAWESKLGRIQISGGDPATQEIFYSALYRTFQMPTVFTDVTGEYVGFDRVVHQAEGFQYYTDFSLWDSFRTVHPLYNLIARGEQADMMASLVAMAKAGGALPRWPSGAGYTNCMFGTPADAAVSEAYLKGIRGFDIDAAYGFLRQTALTGKPESTRFAGREHLDQYLAHGYLPYDTASDAVSATLEYAWCDAALAGLAAALGHTEDAATFARHAQNYRNLWNPATLFFEPRDSSGNFSATIKPLLLSYVDIDRKYTRDYVEGSAMQWRWVVPHDPAGLVSLFPSKEAFVEALQAHFEGSTKGCGEWNPGGNYWHGNEPYIHAAYLFNAAGRPDLTQKWVRWIMRSKYTSDYFGLDGNDDGGTLSAWYVLSALGFYPIAGTTEYALGSPLFDEARVQIGEATLRVTAAENSPENVYVQQVTLNGTPLERPGFTHEAIANGGDLHFVMGPNPK
jgi:predicted alpha-1,2-mannosidase